MAATVTPPLGYSTTSSSGNPFLASRARHKLRSAVTFGRADERPCTTQAQADRTVPAPLTLNRTAIPVGQKLCWRAIEKLKKLHVADSSCIADSRCRPPTTLFGRSGTDRIKVRTMGPGTPDTVPGVQLSAEQLETFRRWALGTLVETRNRGLFAEWLVGTALGVVEQERLEWDQADLRYQDRLIEVKASGRGQVWPQNKPSTPTFDIKQRSRSWNAQTNTIEEFDQPRRVADLYVFCLHQSYPATNSNVADPNEWKFWVVSTETIDAELGDQKTIGLSRLGQLADPVSWGELAKKVENIVNA